MKTPTKKQLTDSVTYFQTALKSLIDDLQATTEGQYATEIIGVAVYIDSLKNILSNAPSLEPQPKAVAEVVEETADVVVEETASV